MQFVKSILILSLSCLTLAEVKIDYNTVPLIIKGYLDKYTPDLPSRIAETKDDEMDVAYRIGNATIDILKDAKKNNDDEYLSAKLMNIKNAETQEELTNTNFDFTTKDPIDEENVKFLAPKAMIEDKYTEIIDKKSTEDNDNDAETSFLLQNMDNSKSSSKDASNKDAGFLVHQYVRNRGV